MYKEQMIERFIEYVKINTRSNPNSESTPSTVEQFNLANLLVKQLLTLGLEINYDKENCYVYAKLAANTSNRKSVAFLAHMDTAPDMSGEIVSPQIIEAYDGEIIKLNDKYNLDPGAFPELKNYIGQTLITTDGTTLLGSDDKAGITEIMEAIKYLVEHPEIKHGDVNVAFSVDEEIGRGADKFDVSAVGADFGYTIDGGAIGELQYENFNASVVNIEISGRNVHPGSAKNKMINASQLAINFHNSLEVNMRPEYTEGYEGFYYLVGINGTTELTTMQYIVRDHDKEKFNKMQQHMEDCFNLIVKPYATESSIVITEQYLNMAEKVRPMYFIIDIAKQAMENLDIEVNIDPIRGGTDGSRLSYMGLVTPNIFTGGHNFHGRYEYVSVDSMLKASQTIVEIVKIIGQKEESEY